MGDFAKAAAVFKQAIADVGAEIKQATSSQELADIFNREGIYVIREEDRVTLHINDIAFDGIPGFGYVGNFPDPWTSYWEVENSSDTKTIFYSDSEWNPVREQDRAFF